MTEYERNLNILTEQPIPEMSAVQLEHFTRETLLARPSGQIDILKAVAILLKSEGEKFLTFDAGGTSIKIGVTRILKNGQIVVTDEQEIKNINHGANYLAEILKVRDKFPELPIAISSGGLIEDNALISWPNGSEFINQLQTAGSLEAIFGYAVSLLNDAHADAIAGAVGVAKRDGFIRPTLSYIKSGGIGGAAVDCWGNITCMEPGHSELVDPALNPNGVTTPCDFLSGWHFVCLERVAASEAGIAAQWQSLRHEKLTGEQIAEKMYAGDQLALQLYATSSLISAHAIAGMRRVMDFPQKDVAVVLHGGAFKTNGMVDRIRQILVKNGENIELIPMAELGFSNGCMAGLAISALMVTYFINPETSLLNSLDTRE